ncbi:hypothetical protein E5288_WYG017896 [Bos mutus]|uniref:Uncharacterized protein n=1 Tax=Bos mutus TaxID=72004 RepID=A0A6B0SAH5_9CETA|nr:hypothetical protein [Bos mutus]
MRVPLGSSLRKGRKRLSSVFLFPKNLCSDVPDEDLNALRKCSCPDSRPFQGLRARHEEILRTWPIPSKEESSQRPAAGFRHFCPQLPRPQRPRSHPEEETTPEPNGGGAARPFASPGGPGVLRLWEQTLHGNLCTDQWEPCCTGSPQARKQVRCKKHLSNHQAQLQAGPERDPQREPLHKAHEDAPDGDSTWNQVQPLSPQPRTRFHRYSENKLSSGTCPLSWLRGTTVSRVRHITGSENNLREWKPQPRSQELTPQAGPWCLHRAKHEPQD